MAEQFPRLGRVTLEEVGDVTVVGFVDRKLLDEPFPPPCAEYFAHLVDELGRRKVMLDLGNVEFWAGWVFGKVITLHRKLQAVGGKLALYAANATMRETFQITRLDRILHIIEAPGPGSLDAAIDAAFGNPFRETAFSPAWRTDTALALARQMYDSREFGAMPILADALQDAGCDNEELLGYCRDASCPAIRHRWMVEVVLGGK